MIELQSRTGIDRLRANRKDAAHFAVGSIDLPGVDEPEFQALFRRVPGMFLATRPDFTIAAASDDLLRKTFTWRENIVNRSVFEVFPDHPSHDVPSGTKEIEASLRDVLASGAARSVRLVRHDIPDRLAGDGQWIEKFWTVLSRPVVDRRNGEARYVLTEARDVTRIIQLAQGLESLDCEDEMEPEIQRSMQRMRGDVLHQGPHPSNVRARITREMDFTGATPQMLIGELRALLYAPGNRLYACAGEWVSDSGVYVAYHRSGCVSARRIRYFAEGALFPACDRCGNDVLYRISRSL